MKMMPDPVEIAQALIRCPSVTPDEGGALAFLEALLVPAGFACHRPVFSDAGTPDVENLYARLGRDGPHILFAGHTDVVPPGNSDEWAHGPFAGEVADAVLFGRGAVDMKGAIACFAAAALGLIEDLGAPSGSIGFLITGDEEGPAVNGTIKLLQWAAERGERFDHCIVGEPSNPQALGDAIKIGRRGSVSAAVTVRGVQGHVAYPHLAANPLRGMGHVLNALHDHVLDEGTGHFHASNLEVTGVDTGNAATNVIPAQAKATLNIRFNDRHTAGELLETLNRLTATALDGTSLDFTIEPLSGSSEAFLTEPGPLVHAMATAVEAETGRKPELSTSGGTSDARFIKNYCPVIEFGLVGQTMHQVDECVAVEDLYRLTAIYRRFLDRYFAA